MRSIPSSSSSRTISRATLGIGIGTRAVCERPVPGVERDRERPFGQAILGRSPHVDVAAEPVDQQQRVTGTALSHREAKTADVDQPVAHPRRRATYWPGAGSIAGNSRSGPFPAPGGGRTSGLTQASQ